MERLVRISPDGKEVVFLYDDKIPWEDLGKMKCERASDVIFNEERQVWVIKFNGGGEVGDFKNREEAIQYEIFILEKMMRGSADVSNTRNTLSAKTEEVPACKNV
jgi:hypothetical protein